MDRIQIPATPRSPEVDFDFAAGRFRLAGESYPEDAAAFFGPLLQALRTYLAASSTDPIVFEVALVYFNSSSAKGLMNLFMPLEDAAEAGRSVTIRWLHAEGDETIAEAGEDFASDFTHARFDLVETAQTGH
ncbi:MULTISPECIES: DUF1987 domain-containing protein [unclassified Methylobacterium]|jgi:hypothetical protein|uniref:DUF1987 domain-containing protein n=1 Tax=unclassified Methylobacterium TaxID=2615210 RepID=UPI0006FD845B|nr:MULTISPECIES: DUF1987 domain-containing protein [unclassified Methylobacterium]KQO49142.1 Fe-S oxidoreductase [Methylobacterium sp. Leaf86]KQP00625.1 Fe-S oxidoreductase [Methylobacterium sp. Leaf91]MBO1019411.1 DUF1987 domain-containing protein [Methylobacterium sp. SD274]